jgi:nicotinamide riboside kinase
METKNTGKNRIVIIGPESTGKTTLCRQLAEYYKTLWLPEFARTYVENLNRSYQQNDVLLIARKQIELEEEYSLKTNFLFIDTDVILTKVWLQHVYGSSPDWIDIWLHSAPRLIYLVCKPDLPWEYDRVRENPNIRVYLMNWYCNEIKLLNLNYGVVYGTGDERFLSAIEILKKVI